MRTRIARSPHAAHARDDRREAGPGGTYTSARAAATVTLGLIVLAGTVAPAWAGTTERVSVGPDGRQIDGASQLPAISADGRFVAFSSATVAGQDGLLVRDRRTGKVRIASAGAGGVEADGPSYDPALSADGRFVAFTSQAANLVAGDRNGQFDIFVHDLRTGKTVRASLGVGAAEGNGFSSGPALSADGRVVAFGSQATNLVPGDTNGETDVFVRYLRTGRTVRASIGTGGAQGDEDSFGAALSADGRVVAFLSPATTLVPRDTNRDEDIFVRDLRAGTTERVSVRAGGGQADDPSRSPAISADGRAVVFESEATNLVPGDTNGERDVFVRTR